MKLRHIFALVPDCHVAGWRYAEVWRRHFYEGLAQTGAQVVFPRGVDFGWARPPQSFDLSHAADARRRTSEALLAQIIAAGGNPPQVVLSCCFSHDIELDLVDRVRAAGIPWINFFCDSAYAFDWVSALATRTSLNWFVETQAEERYRALGVPCLRAPYALNPDALPDASVVTPEHALLFVGTANRHRIRAAAFLRLLGADLQVCGCGWEESLGFKSAASRCEPGPATRAARLMLRALLGTRVKGHLDYNTMIEELRQAAVVLGLNEGSSDGNVHRYLKLRDLEVPGMGCCYLAQHHDDLANTFELGREVLTFRTAWEAGRLARDLARHPAECREIGRRARVRVLGEHTWTARLRLLETRL